MSRTIPRARAGAAVRQQEPRSEARPLPAACAATAPGAGRFGGGRALVGGDRHHDLPRGALRRRGRTGRRRLGRLERRRHPRGDDPGPARPAARHRGGRRPRGRPGPRRGRASARRPLLPRANPSGCWSPGSAPGLDFGDLPVPRLIVLKLAGGARPISTRLRKGLAERCPAPSLDDHGLWLSRLSTMANTVVCVGVVLVGAGARRDRRSRSPSRPAAPWPATARSWRCCISSAPTTDYIAREFQRHFFRLGLQGQPPSAAGPPSS